MLPEVIDLGTYIACGSMSPAVRANAKVSVDTIVQLIGLSSSWPNEPAFNAN